MSSSEPSSTSPRSQRTSVAAQSPVPPNVPASRAPASRSLPVLGRTPGPGIAAFPDSVEPATATVADVSAILRSLLARAVDAIGGFRGMALVMDAQRRSASCRAVYRLPSQGTDSLVFRAGEGNTGSVMQSGKPLRLNPDANGGGSHRGALLIVPVLMGDEVIAVLNINGTSSSGGFTPADEAKVMSLANEAAPQLFRAIEAEYQAGGVGGLSLSRLVPPGVLKEVQDACSQMLRIPCVFEDAHGRCLAPISSAADLCVLMRSKPTSAVQCELSMAQAGSVAEDTGSACLHECHAGVLTLVTPIFVRGIYVGSLTAMLRYENRDSAAVRTRASELDLDPYDVLSKASAFPTAAPEHEAAIRVLTAIFARTIGAIADERLNSIQEQEHTNRMSREIHELRELARQLTGVMDLELVLAETMRRAIKLAGAAAADISLVSVDGQLQMRAHRGFSEEAAALLEPAVLDSPAARVVSTGRSYFVDDVATEAACRAWTHAVRRQEQLKSAISLLLSVQGKPTGALTVYFDTAAAREADVLHLMLALADHASLAIQSAQAAEQARSNEQALRVFLARMTRGFSSSINTGQLIEWIANFSAEMAHAAHCVLYEVVGDEVRVRSTNRTSRTVIEKAAMPVGEGLSGTVASTRRLLYVPDVRKDPRFVTASSAIPLDAVTYLGVPLLYQSELVGVLSVYSSPRTYVEEDLQLLWSFAGQAAVAIQNARTYEHQHEIATTMQQSFLPRERLRMSGLEVGQLFVPALEEVGGDYYDFIVLDNQRAMVVLGDVSGKGIRAATYTAMGKYVLRAYAHEEPVPERVLTRVNALLAEQMELGTFITMFCGVVDLGAMTLRFANAGHPDGLLFHPSTGKFTHLRSTGIMVGAMRGEEFHGVTLDIHPGDILVIYTDGVIEARDGQELFGIPRLMNVIAENHSLPADDLASVIHQQATQFQKTGMADDICILVLRFTGAQ